MYWLRYNKHFRDSVAVSREIVVGYNNLEHAWNREEVYNGMLLCYQSTSINCEQKDNVIKNW